MYRVEQLDNESWAIVDRGGLTLFVGTMRQCEDWLDHRQNLERLANHVSLWQRCMRWLGRYCSRQHADSSRNESYRRAKRTAATESRLVDSDSEVESFPAA